MTSLLDLPREIRNMIYLAVLNSEFSPPYLFLKYRRDHKQIFYHYGASESRSEYYCEHHNRYPLQPVFISSSGLLLTNRQIRAEILEIIALLKARKQLRYKIDCLIEDEKRIYPTWLSVPVVSFHIDIVEVNFRLIGRRHGRSGFAHGSPGTLIWSLFALLNRFLERGPDFLSLCKTRQKMEVELITLNIVTPAEPAEGFIPEDMDRSTDIGVTHPENVLLSIMRELDYLLRKTKHTERYAKTVYDGVHRMKLMLDGKTRMEWDLVAMETARQQATASSELLEGGKITASAVVEQRPVQNRLVKD